jgi:hypothetical protein
MHMVLILIGVVTATGGSVVGVRKYRQFERTQLINTLPPNPKDAKNAELRIMMRWEAQLARHEGKSDDEIVAGFINMFVTGQISEEELLVQGAFYMDESKLKFMARQALMQYKLTYKDGQGYHDALAADNNPYARTKLETNGLVAIADGRVGVVVPVSEKHNYSSRMQHAVSAYLDNLISHKELMTMREKEFPQHTSSQVSEEVVKQSRERMNEDIRALKGEVVKQKNTETMVRYYADTDYVEDVDTSSFSSNMVNLAAQKRADARRRRAQY